jgi:hypothetical protein
MTQDIIEMAREAGIGWAEGLGGMPEFLEAFAKLVAEAAAAKAVEREREEFAVHAVDIARRAIAKEREACAKLCDAEAEFSGSNGKKDASASNSAYAIRARGTNEYT